MNSRSAILRAIAISAAASLAISAQAQTLNKAANTTALNLAASWVESAAPTSSDTLVFSADWTNPATVTMGASLDVAGLQLGTLANASGRISGAANQTLTIGAGGINGSAMTNTFRIDPAIILSANQTWSIAASRTLNLVASGVTSPGGFKATVTGSGTLAFNASGNGTYGSEFEIDSTALQINFASSNVTITNAANSYTTLNINAGRGNFATIANSGFDSAAGIGTVTTTLGGNNTNGVFAYTGSNVSTNRTFTRDTRSTSSGIEVTTAGQTLTITSNLLVTGTQAADTNWNFGGAGNLAISGTIAETSNATLNQGVVKTGTGTLKLSGNNTYAGGTTVSAGTLLVNNTTGSGTGTGNVSVAAGASLGGTGTVTPGTGNALSISGNIAPGDGGVGTLTFNGASTSAILATFASGAGFSFDLNATSVTSDRLSLVSGAAGDLAFNNNLITFSLTGSLSNGQTYTLFSADVAGAYSGLTFDGLNKVTAGLTFTGLGGAYDSNSYISLVGNNLVLTAVPEPATWLLLSLGLTGAVVFRRRRMP